MVLVLAVVEVVVPLALGVPLLAEVGLAYPSLVPHNQTFFEGLALPAEVAHDDVEIFTGLRARQGAVDLAIEP